MEESKCLKMLSCKPTGRRQLGKPRGKWQDNIRMNFKEIGVNSRNSIDSTKASDPPGFVIHRVI